MAGVRRRTTYPEIEFNQMHTDLTYPLRRISYISNLEAIKRMRGVTRSKSMMGSRGCAVRLWHEYGRGSDDAHELLLKCEPGAVVDLETIIEPRAS